MVSAACVSGLRDAMPLSFRERIMRVQVIGGLCNRLRVMISYLIVARRLGESLEVFWYPHVACPTLFRELFEATPADCVIRDGVIAPQGTETTCSRHKDAGAEASWRPVIAEVLRPLPALQARIDAGLAALGPDFTALHIRRTDHNANYDQDAAFAAFAASGTGRVFVAADNPRSVANVKRILGERVFWTAQYGSGIGGLRLTSVQDAVVDLWIAAHAIRFKGTYYSSFSDWIETMRSVGEPGDLAPIH